MFVKTIKDNIFGYSECNVFVCEKYRQTMNDIIYFICMYYISTIYITVLAIILMSLFNSDNEIVKASYAAV